jgi:hypothetical protein
MPIHAQSHVPVSADGDTAAMLCLPARVYCCAAFTSFRDARLAVYAIATSSCVQWADRPTLGISRQPGGVSA